MTIAGFTGQSLRERIAQVVSPAQPVPASRSSGGATASYN
jgi:hypothetical protein